MTTKFVSYLRVSTQQQGREGLGMDAQREAVKIHSCSGVLLKEFVEVESGKNNDRPQLQAALAHCLATGATLLVAKLDRLSRNVEFIARLMNSKVNFIAADMPTANKLTLHIMAAMAEHEREQTSIRTKQALQAAKRRGVKLGGVRPGNGWKNGAHNLGVQAKKHAAEQFAARLAPTLKEIGAKPFRKIAEELVARSIQTPTGTLNWTATTVRRVCLRVNAL